MAKSSVKKKLEDIPIPFSDVKRFNLKMKRRNHVVVDGWYSNLENIFRPTFFSPAAS